MFTYQLEFDNFSDGTSKLRSLILIDQSENLSNKFTFVVDFLSIELNIFIDRMEKFINNFSKYKKSSLIIVNNSVISQYIGFDDNKFKFIINYSGNIDTYCFCEYEINDSQFVLEIFDQIIQRLKKL